MADERFDNELNFSKILFLHINRTLISAIQSTLFIVNVEAFEGVLCPYIDDEYETRLKAEMNAYKYFTFLDPMLRERDAMIDRKRLELAWQKFRALMSLAERKGLLLEKKGEGYDTEDENDSNT